MASENAGYAVLTVIPSVRGIGAQMGSQLNAPIVKAGRQAGDDLGTTLTSRAGASIRRGASQISSAVSTVAAGAAAAGGAALGAGFSSALDMSTATGRFQSQLGVTETEAARIGAVAGQVYASGFGASMPEVSQAVGSVVQNMQWMRDASSADLEEISRQAINLADTLGIDVNEAARSVANMVTTGIAPDAESAMDLLIRGAQLGADEYNDLADTMQEYSTQFRDLGLSGEEAMGLIVQATQNGAQSSDRVGDSLKELNIRVQSLDTNAVGALEGLGLSAEQMAAAFAEGGPAARTALEEILGGLQGVEDDAQRSELAFALMGTQAEDLAGALDSMNLGTAASELGTVAGAASDAADAMEQTDAQQLSSAWRELKTVLGEELAPVLTQVTEWVTNNMDTVKQAGAAVLGLGAAWAAYKVAATAATVATGTWNVGKGIVQGAADGGKALGDLARKGRPALDGLRLRAMYAGDSIKGAGAKAATAAKGGITTAASAATRAGRAALTSARHWGALALAQTRAAVSATRARVATIATAVAQRAVRLATIAWTGVQWLLNTALTANPIGLIVVGIGLLIGAVVLAYNKVGWFRDLVNAAFSGIGAAATWLGEQGQALWTKYLSPALSAIADGAMWLYNKGIKPPFAWITRTLLGVGATGYDLWHKYLQPPLAAITKFVVGKVLGSFTTFRTGVGVAVGGVKAAISTAVEGGRTALGWLRDGIGATKRAFDRGQEGIGKALDKIRSAAKRPVKFFVNDVYNSGIRKVWNWVADKVGLGTIDKVTLPSGFARGGVLGGRSSWRQGDDQVIRARRGEGVAVSEAMRVPALRSELLRWNRIGVQGGTTALQRYAAGRAPQSGTAPRVRDLAQGAGYARGGVLPGYAEGGIVDAVSSFGRNIVTGFLTGGLSGAVDEVAAPLVNIIKDKFGRTGIKGLPTRGVEYLVGGLKDKIKSFSWLEATNGGAADWVGLATASRRLQAAAEWVDTQVGLPYQWGGGGNPSWDCSGFMAGIENVIRGLRPARRYTTMDFRGTRAPSGWVRGLRSPFEVGVVNGSSARGSHMSGTLLGVNVESSGSAGVHKGTSARGASHSMYTDRYGFAPVAYAVGGPGSQSTAGGGAQLYDDGGWLRPGYTMVENRTGKPEAVYTSAQQDRIDRLVRVLEGRGHQISGHTFHITGDGDGRRTARRVVTALSDWERLHPVP
ncbi:phage tail tape measure protein [Nocardiopsis sp. EMB25]|uniref:phage tail tape measure protein n=1 Tax=Nocardiopsis sp. EMB25 TaxID=2835867 RepID=UPI002283D968|nr:phage tail tape measure protein [Nocardiopsis sp. EMB25]MCY9786827.1 phage tail tape measure protein [Nocardiopsis sp. EMB25]